MRISRNLFSSATTRTFGNKTVTTLPNGLRILSHPDSHGLAACGVVTQIGSRYEDDNSIGCSAVFSKYLCHNNLKCDSNTLATDFAFLGNSFNVQNHRESVSYLLQCPNYYIPQALDVISGALLSPDIYNPVTFAEVKNSLIENISKRNRDPSQMCFELMHQAAFGGRTLGRSEHYAECHLKAITPTTMENFLRDKLHPANTVVAGSGVWDHDAFVEMISKCFDFSLRPTERPVVEPSKFVGGVAMIHNTQPPESVERFEEKNSSHIAVFCPVSTKTKNDYFAVSVIQCMMGGGQSFSSGGPGKGMLTKLYREVISKEGWVQGAECISATYSDAGMLGLYGSAPHDFNQHLLRVLLLQIATIPYRVDTYHLEMAKQHFLSQLYLVNDTKMAQLEEAARHLSLFDSPVSFDEAKELVNSVTLDDIKRVCSGMLQSPPAVAIYGNTSGIGDINAIHSVVQTAAAKRR
eukprot:PhF_6_TR30460/c0_g1_i1/m.44746/K01412/PMPCA, MAS2; mitochondrial-processing peptidase subunit alpha